MDNEGVHIFSIISNAVILFGAGDGHDVGNTCWVISKGLLYTVKSPIRLVTLFPE